MGQSNTPGESERRSGKGVTKRNVGLGMDEVGTARRKANDGCAAVIRGESEARRVPGPVLRIRRRFFSLRPHVPSTLSRFPCPSPYPSTRLYRVGLDPKSQRLHEGDDQPDKHTWVEPQPTGHLYYAPANPDANRVRVEATDCFGRTYVARHAPAPDASGPASG